MPITQVIVEATSPLISYDSGWKVGLGSLDPLTDQYSQASFTLTETANTQLSFAFDGFSATVVGAKRANHGKYRVTVDGPGGSTTDGFGVGDNAFNQTLARWDGQQGRHTLTLENSEKVFLDFDYLAFSTNVGGDGDSLFVETHQESSRAFSFSPPSSWVVPPMNSAFLGGSGVATQDTNAGATFSFTGDGVTLYGAVGPGYRVTYSVQVDGGTPTLFSAPPSNRTTHQEIIFAAFGLGQKAHKIDIKLANPPPNGQMLSIDYANVYTTSSTSSSNGQAPLDMKIALGVTSALAGIFLLFALTVVFGPRYGFHFYVQPRENKREAPPHMTRDPEVRMMGNTAVGIAGPNSDYRSASRHTPTPSESNSLAGPSRSVSPGNGPGVSAIDLLRREKGRVMTGTPPAYATA